MTPTVPLVVSASLVTEDVGERVEFLADTFVLRVLGYIHDDSDVVAAARRAAAQARIPNMASRETKKCRVSYRHVWLGLVRIWLFYIRECASMNVRMWLFGILAVS